MKGTVYQINEQRGMVAVLTGNGDFSIFEILGAGTIERGDEIQWRNDAALGGEMLTNLTQGETYEVYFQNHCVPKVQVKQQLLY